MRVSPGCSIPLICALVLAACAPSAAPARAPIAPTAALAPLTTPSPTPSPLPATLPPAATPPRRSYEVTIWAPSVTIVEQRTLTDNADVIKEVNFSWYQLEADGSIAGSVQSREGVAAARAAGLRIVPSIQNGGFDRARVARLIHDPAQRSRHVAEILRLVQENGFGGIDIDYESLNAEDRDDFSVFIEELAGALHAQGKRLSIAVHAKTDAQGSWNGPQAQDWARLGAAVDSFKIMTYDFHYAGGPAGSIAPLDWVDQVLTYAATAVPPTKTYLGVPLYGYDWAGAAAQSLNWGQATQLRDTNHAQVQRDASNEGFFSYGSDGQDTVYFNDGLTMQTRLRAALAKHPQIAGIALWSLGGEDPANWTAIREAFAGK
jgi:spore germination protein